LTRFQPPLHEEYFARKSSHTENTIRPGWLKADKGNRSHERQDVFIK
jgi:hypothetical protein